MIHVCFFPSVVWR